MRLNKMKAKLQAGEVVVGLGLQFPTPQMVEMVGALGFDHITIDAEHNPMDESQMEELIRGADAFDITPIARISFSEERIVHYLDAGAMAVHIPHINTPAEAHAVVEAARFHPEGKRTFYTGGRVASYGVGVDAREFLAASNREVLVLCQLEEVEAVRNLAEILAVPGVDAIQIGPDDLWQSMGFPDRSEVARTMDHMIAESVKAGKFVSLALRLTPNFEEDLAHYMDLGVRKFDIGVPALLHRAGADILRQVRDRAAAAL